MSEATIDASEVAIDASEVAIDASEATIERVGSRDRRVGSRNRRSLATSDASFTPSDVSLAAWEAPLAAWEAPLAAPQASLATSDPPYPLPSSPSASAHAKNATLTHAFASKNALSIFARFPFPTSACSYTRSAARERHADEVDSRRGAGEPGRDERRDRDDVRGGAEDERAGRAEAGGDRVQAVVAVEALVLQRVEDVEAEEPA